jgi:hypothetical protein
MQKNITRRTENEMVKKEQNPQPGGSLYFGLKKNQQE